MMLLFVAVWRRCGGGAAVIRRWCGAGVMPMSHWFGANDVQCGCDAVPGYGGAGVMPMSRWFGAFFSTILVLFIVPSSLV